ncbi:hypothetical protein CTAYLR_009007 [Chrysophaeum taylorii]|uniref:Protein kinase domain-containing protein n=1 Tax=Chrysophaeum taylorii TaxID=2483200 RepID=A0AAD7UMQ8_9STRA|nr:hypothetical protein CTAYLR_009007 [Chrysophaeum taylorii]
MRLLLLLLLGGGSFFFAAGVFVRTPAELLRAAQQQPPSPRVVVVSGPDAGGGTEVAWSPDIDWNIVAEEGNAVLARWVFEGGRVVLAALTFENNGGVSSANARSLAVASCRFSSGARLSISGAAVATVEGTTFAAGSTSGLVVVDAGNILVVDCLFRGRRATALLVEKGDATIENATFEENRARQGGALRCGGAQASRIRVVNSSFVQNYALAPARSGLAAEGGAIFVGTNCAAEIAGSTFRANRATPENGEASAGCLSGRGGAIAAVEATMLECVSSRFYDNVAASGATKLGAEGGAVYLAYQHEDAPNSSTFVDCDFYYNEAYGRTPQSSVEFGGGASGGAVSVSYASPKFFGCTFASNLATGGPNDPARGGALRLVFATDETLVWDCKFVTNQVIGYLESGSFFAGGAHGGAVSVESSNPRFSRALFDGNVANAGRRGQRGGLVRPLVEALLGDTPAGTSPYRHNRLYSELSALGGAIHLTASSSPYVELCEFRDNHAGASGHDISATGGEYAAYDGGNSTTFVHLVNCTFSGMIPVVVDADDFVEDAISFVGDDAFAGPKTKIHEWLVEDPHFLSVATEAIVQARVVALGARVDINGPIRPPTASSSSLDEDSGEARLVSGLLQIVVLGSQSSYWGTFDLDAVCRDRDRTANSAVFDDESELDDFRNAAGSSEAWVKNVAGVRVAAAERHNASYLSILALRADVFLGQMNETATIKLEQLYVVGGFCFLESVLTTVHGAIILDNSGLVAFGRRVAALELEQRTSQDTSLIGPVIGDNPRDYYSSSSSSSSSQQQQQQQEQHFSEPRRGYVGLCGATLNLNAGRIVVANAQLELLQGARFIIQSGATVTLLGTSIVDSEPGARIASNGTLQRVGDGTMDLGNSTFWHDGVIDYYAYLTAESNPPVLEACRVKPGPAALVNATLAKDVVVSDASRWTIYRQDNASSATAAKTAIAGASDGIGLRLEDVVDRDNKAVLAAAVDYVDCEARVVGRYFFDDDTSSRFSSAGGGGPPNSTVVLEDLAGTKQQCLLCLGNSSCSFSYDAARDANTVREDTGLARVDGIVVCAAAANVPSGYDYRSKDCCERGCGVGGTCDNGHCKCTWWWSGRRCVALSWKARMTIILGVVAIMCAFAVAAYVVLWRRRKSRAIGEVLDELRQNLLDVDAYSDRAPLEEEEAAAAAAGEVRDTNDEEACRLDGEATTRLLGDDDAAWTRQSWSPANPPPEANNAVATRASFSAAAAAAASSSSSDGRREGPPPMRRRSRSTSALLDAKVAVAATREVDNKNVERRPSSPNDGRPSLPPPPRPPRAGGFLRAMLGTSSSLLLPEAPPKPARATSTHETSKLFDPEYLRDVRQRLVLRDVLVRRAELDIHECIGSGAFGDVYRGRHRGCDVAVKKLRIANFAHDETTLIEEVDRFRAEAVLMARLRHPNVLMIMGVVVDDDDDDRAYFASLSRSTSFRTNESSRAKSTERPPDAPSVAPPPLLAMSIVTEFLALRSLADLLYDEARYNPAAAVSRRRGQPREAPLPEDAWSYELVLVCALQAARGMLYLHSRSPPICHRDLKTANLMVDDHWVVKVGDYGLSRFVGPSSSGSNNSAKDGAELFMTADLGTLRWRAAETFGRGRRLVSYSTKADVYSFGMCLLELYNRTPPWPDLRSRFDIVDAVLAGHLQLLDPPPPPPFARLFASCCSLDPAARPSFSRVVSDLDAELRRVRQTTATTRAGAPPDTSRRTFTLPSGTALPRVGPHHRMVSSATGRSSSSSSNGLAPATLSPPPIPPPGGGIGGGGEINDDDLDFEEDGALIWDP